MCLAVCGIVGTRGAGFAVVLFGSQLIMALVLGIAVVVAVVILMEASIILIIAIVMLIGAAINRNQ